ncbi:hypothetical protein V5799_007498 [Amblyomma americanum]
MVAQLCRAHDVICVMDEVYEWIIYEGVKHVRMNTLPDMWERTITIGSAGKAFSITGWRVRPFPIVFSFHKSTGKNLWGSGD